MARLRTIKPGFFLDEELAECEPLARLLFAGLWTIADREGRLEDRPRRIKAECLPYDECDCDALLDELAGRGLIVRYEAAGRPYIAIPSWHKHQQPHYKEAPSVIPAPTGAPADSYSAEPVTGAQRERILERDGRRCVECGSAERLSIDHIVPRSRGGSSADDNLQTLCVRCNSAKGNRDRAASIAQPCADVESTSGQGRAVVARGLLSLGSCLLSSEETPCGNPADPHSGGEDLEEAFEGWWVAYGRVGDKARARDLYLWWRRAKRVDAADLLAAAIAYRAHCEATDCKLKHAATFLAKPARGKSAIWPEWATGEPHGGMEPRRDRVLSDVLAAGAEAFGLNGGVTHDNRTVEPGGGSSRPVGGRPDDRRGLPAGRLAD